ncbi:hypothetical protein JCGZ_12792 [Jatropha curcas]|uniref:Aminotransferase-like plant mobile domain-containing protein n=1 Tax=Jatropha curcas TaxID=180498 RepID=A0A067KE88_JATCU|nr:hypothetical protein JCGZ_12792 [Jatropha curcas]
MSQISEIPASAYTREMETLGALPDIPFDGEPMPVSQNQLTPGTRLLQLLPSPGTEFPVRYETSRMRGFQSEVWSYEYCIYPGGPSGDSAVESRRIPRYLVHCHHTYASGEDPEYWRSFLNDRELSDPGREVAELHTRSRLLMRGYWADRYFLGERVFDTSVAQAQRRVPHAPPRHMCLLEGLTREDLEVEYRGFLANDFLSVGDFPSYFASRMQARLPEILEYTQITDTVISLCNSTQERKTHKTVAYYRAEAATEAGGAAAPVGSAGVVLGDVPFPPGIEVVLDPSLGLGSGIIIPTVLRQAPPPVQLDPEHTTHDLENGRLRRHQSRQSNSVSRLQAEVQRLRMKLEVEGIPLDSSEEDEDGSSSDDAPPSPPPPAVAGLSRPRYDLTEIVALCPVFLPDGVSVDQGLPLEPFLKKNRQPEIGDFRLLTIVQDMQLYHHTVFMMIMGETMYWVRDIALHITEFNVHHRGYRDTRICQLVLYPTMMSCYVKAGLY